METNIVFGVPLLDISSCCAAVPSSDAYGAVVNTRRTIPPLRGKQYFFLTLLGRRGHDTRSVFARLGWRDYPGQYGGK